MNVKVYKRKKFLKYLKHCEEKHSKKIKSEENRRLWDKVLKMRRYEQDLHNTRTKPKTY